MTTTTLLLAFGVISNFITIALVYYYLDKESLSVLVEASKNVVEYKLHRMDKDKAVSESICKIEQEVRDLKKKIKTISKREKKKEGNEQ
jgi:hypothetical protein